MLGVPLFQSLHFWWQYDFWSKELLSQNRKTNLNIPYYISWPCFETKWLAACIDTFLLFCCQRNNQRSKSNNLTTSAKKPNLKMHKTSRTFLWTARQGYLGGDLRSVSWVKCVCRKNRREEDREPTEARLQALISYRGCLQAAISSRETSQGLKRHQSSRIHLHCIIYRYRFLLPEDDSVSYLLSFMQLWLSLFSLCLIMIQTFLLAP